LPVFKRPSSKFATRRGKKSRLADDALKLDLNYRDDENFAGDALFLADVFLKFLLVAPYAHF
jgi:hypothetical protein